MTYDDKRRTDTSEDAYTIISPGESHGSGELKTYNMHLEEYLSQI